MSIRRLASSLAEKLEARFRRVATAKGRRCLNWVLAELAHSPALYRIVDDIVDHLVQNPEVEELVRRQSVTLVGQAVDELRTGAERADTALDQVVLAFRRRWRRT